MTEEIDKLLNGFEAASAYHARYDEYRFYFEYNLALHRLVRILCIARGAPAKLYLPESFIDEVLSENERDQFQRLTGEMCWAQINALKRRFLDFLYGVLEEIQTTISSSLRHTLPEIRTFCEYVYARDLINDFRANP